VPRCPHPRSDAGGGSGHFISLHALLVLVLAPPLGWVLSRFQRRGQELSTPGKMAWGFVATNAAFLVMGLAGLRASGEAQVGPSWLGGCYVLLAVGELLLAPMGLSLITRLAPPERASRMVALWGVATAVGNVLAGALGFLWTRWPRTVYFALLALLALGAAVLLRVRMRALERLLGRAESVSDTTHASKGGSTDGKEI
jgi:POT family proton-dependent oligopeptide transporter